MSAKLDLVLINPGSRTQVYQSLATKLTAVENPVWAGLMATFCRRRGLSVAVIDAEAEELVPDEVAERIQDLDPVLAAVVVYGHQPSASTQMMAASGQVCTAIRQLASEQPVLLVGGHVAAMPERTLAEEAADFVAAGEGLHTLVGLVEALKSPASDLAAVPGLWYRQAGQVCHTPDRSLVAALDGEMPGPAWDLFPMDRYRAHNWHCLGGLDRQPYAALYTTLGCPYHCSFCLAKGTTIVTAQGRNKKIQNVRVGDELMAWDEKGGKLSHTTVVATGCRVVAGILRVETAGGFTILITDEHPVYTRRGWIEAGELTTEDEVWAMDPHDKVCYLRRTFNGARRPEVRAKIAAGKRGAKNPMKRAEVRAKVSATNRENREELSARLRQRWAEGKMVGHPISEEQRRATSERMTHSNPMHRAEVAAKVSEAQSRLIESGEIVPWMCTEEGRAIIAEIARERARTDNPMKDPAVARAPELVAARSDRMMDLWQDEERADALMEARKGTYLTGPNNPNWQGGISRDPYPPEFSPYYKRKVKKRDGYTCQLCGTQDRNNLCIHHIDYDKANSDPCNWITLCNPCNARVNFGRDKWKAHFQALMAGRGRCPHFTRVVRITRVRKDGGKYKVYNFQCSPHDNYFAEHLLVHNCCIQAPFKSGERAAGLRESANSYRYWSPDTIIEQIDLLVNRYGVRNLKIADEMFVLNRRHVLGICDRLIERGYGLNIWAYTRVDTIKDGMLDRLKEAGFNWLAFGIEAGADRVRAGVDKSIDQDEVYRVLARVRAAGINVIGNYIFGLPEDDPETMQATLDLALDLNCQFANFYSAMAYPGSPLYALAVRQGIPLPERWTGYSQHSRDCLPLPTRHVPAREVLQFRDDAFLRYYTDPRYLEMVGRRFGAETVAHIRQMTTYRLERDLLTGKLPVPPVTLSAAGAQPAHR
jgi:radical SAM superfamily enzyme YgiQ (UPF0313 family)